MVTMLRGYDRLDPYHELSTTAPPNPTCPMSPLVGSRRGRRGWRCRSTGGHAEDWELPSDFFEHRVLAGHVSPTLGPVHDEFVDADLVVAPDHVPEVLE